MDCERWARPVYFSLYRRVRTEGRMLTIAQNKWDTSMRWFREDERDAIEGATTGE
jgi:hypothetical protein